MMLVLQRYSWPALLSSDAGRRDTRVCSPCSCLPFVELPVICCVEALCKMKSPTMQATCLPSVHCPIFLSPCQLFWLSKDQSHSSVECHIYLAFVLYSGGGSGCQLLAVLATQDRARNTCSDQLAQSEMIFDYTSASLNARYPMFKVELCMWSRFGLLRGKHRKARPLHHTLCSVQLCEL